MTCITCSCLASLLSLVAVQPMTCITCSCLASLLSLLVVAAPAHITCGCLRSSLVIANWRLSGWPIRQVSEKDSELFNKNGPTKRTQFLRYQPPMDTKFGTIYCAISDVGYFLYLQLQLPQNCTDRNAIYGILKS